MLALVELDGYGERYPRELSGGQQQRVAVARALAFQPALLLMDEPLGALDRALRIGMQEEIRRIHRESGATILYVTHDQEEALTMSDRVAILRDGRLLQVGVPRDLYRRPADRFVATFFGECTLVPATLLAPVDADHVRVAALGREAIVRRGGPSLGADVSLAIRPGKLRLRPAPGDLTAAGDDPRRALPGGLGAHRRSPTGGGRGRGPSRPGGSGRSDDRPGVDPGVRRGRRRRRRRQRLMSEMELAATETVVALRWRDMDAYGHVNHVVYLTYLEEARDAAIARILRETPGEGGYVVARVAIDYRRELRLSDGPVVVSCAVTTIGGASAQTRETIHTATGELAAEAEAVVVKFDRETRRSRQWTDAERQAFAAAGARSGSERRHGLGKVKRKSSGPIGVIPRNEGSRRFVAYPVATTRFLAAARNDTNWARNCKGDGAWRSVRSRRALARSRRGRRGSSRRSSGRWSEPSSTAANSTRRCSTRRGRRRGRRDSAT